MTGKPSGQLLTQDGRRGEVEFDTGREGFALLHMENGQQVWAPVDLIEAREDGSYYLPLNWNSTGLQNASPHGERQTILVVPVVQEELVVDKELRVSGRVRVHKKVHTREEVVDEPGFVEEVLIERVPVNKLLDAPVSSRQEGDTLIIPLMEEMLVVEKRLVLKEELHVKKHRKEVRNPQTVTLRNEEVLVERLDEQGD